MDPLVTMLLIAAGPIIAVFTEFSDDEPETDPEEQVIDARDASDIVNITDNILRGTDADEEMLGEEDTSNVFDASGGVDTVTGGMGNDTLIGGEDGDIITGGDGDDALFGGFARETRADDMDADTLDGGDGDDVLVIGDGDTATGGLGADTFAVVQDATGNATITDFDTEMDALVIESADAESLEVIAQELDDTGLLVTLNTGLTLTLPGLDTELDEGAINFVTVEALEVLEVS